MLITAQLAFCLSFFYFEFIEQMNTIVRRVAIFAIFLEYCLLSPGRIPVASAGESDISCLKSLKDSVQDPYGYLVTWDFTNATVEGFICNFVGIQCWHADENKVLNIRLNDTGLMGEFPSGLENCTSLTGLDLSGNQLSGPIPSDIDGKLPFVVSLDLSNNHFTGLIPPSIANCSMINVLKLDNNTLSGPIPSELGQMIRIKTITVANNSLTGPVPEFIESTSIQLNYENNPGLCGGPLLKHCNYEHHRSIFFRGFIIGWAVSASLVFFVCLFAIPGTAVKKLIPDQNNKKKKSQTNGASLWLRWKETNSGHRMTKLDKYITRIPFAELTDATGNFSRENVIWPTGKMGTMYKGTLPNGWFLAIKRIFYSEQLDRQIIAEILTLGRLRHRTLVPLFGFCIDKNDIFLAYKYMSNGNLYDWLHPRQGESKIIGCWPLRVKIAVGIAEGLAWLHQNSSFNVIHGTISSKCILLDTNFEPKLSNFWQAKIIKSKDSTTVWSFIGTCDSQELDYHRDVYCFGIMLLELITGKEPRELASSIRNLRSTYLFAYFSSLFEFDQTLIGQGFDDQIHEFLQVAKNCLQFNPGQRPSMVQVYETLAAFAHIENGASDCTISFS